MTREEREELFAFWELYDNDKRRKIIAEYLESGGSYCQESWLRYLQGRLEIREYWKAVGLA